MEEDGFKEWPPLDSVFDTSYVIDVFLDEEKDKYPLLMRALQDLSAINATILYCVAEFSNIQKLMHVFPKGRFVKQVYQEFFSKFDKILGEVVKSLEYIAPYAFHHQPKIYMTLYKHKLSKFIGIALNWMPTVQQYVYIGPHSSVPFMSIPKIDEFSKIVQTYFDQISELIGSVALIIVAKTHDVKAKRIEKIRNERQNNSSMQLNAILAKLNRITERRTQLEQATENLGLLVQALNFL